MYILEANFLYSFIEKLNINELILLLICGFTLIYIISYKIRIELKARYYLSIKKRIEKLEQEKEPRK